MKMIGLLIVLMLTISSLLVLIKIENINVHGNEIPTRGIDKWTTDMNISDVSEASFLGENSDDISGHSISGVGDVNGDGFDDLLIGAPGNKDGGNGAGQTYLIFGKANGWSMDINLSNAGASFIGEESDDRSGNTVSDAGDVNGDGYDDILIGAPGNGEGGVEAGQTYLIFGKSNGWSMDNDLSNADASFIGENSEDCSGCCVSGAGDVNADGYDDILIGAKYNDDSGQNAGKSYLIFGHATGWGMNNDLADADVSFVGENEIDFSGYFVACNGDVNADGFSDILIGARENSDGASYAGKTYLILGKASGWKKSISLANSDASFIGEGNGDRSGNTVTFAGDVNGDGFDDILISSRRNGDIGHASGKTYLIFGKASGWTKNTNLANADASFRGENPRDSSACSVSPAGDVNGDGFDDILIGAYGNNDGGNSAGKSYLILGKSIGWKRNEDLINASASFIGEKENDQFGSYVSDAGDVNGDSLDDIIIGAPQNDGGGIDAGKAYLIFGKGYDEPLAIYSVDAYSDPVFSNIIDKTDFGDKIYIELIGLDGNESNQDRCSVTIVSNITHLGPRIILKETGINTGVFRGDYIVNPLSFNYLEKIVISSMVNSSIQAEVLVHTPVQIRPFKDNKTAYEDIEYREQYWNFGWDTNTTWTWTTDKDWIYFDQKTKELYGTPDNTELGHTTVELNLTDSEGHFSSRQFKIIVWNTNPNLIGTDITEINQGEYYETDYNCDDDGQGDVTYYLSSDAEWLTMNYLSGIMNGTPTNDDVGTITVTVSVHDGNEGWDSRQFDITVLNINDAPIIITEDITSINQDESIVRKYIAEDIDLGDELRWHLHTDTDFLQLNEETGRLTGSPSYMEVGSYFVNISVWDLSDAFDFHNFTLEVINVNDVPIWEEFPENVDVTHGEIYLFQVNTTDYDGDSIEYEISSTPESEITIEELTGLINWTADIHLFDQAPYKLEVKVSAWDGQIYLNRTFTITVLTTEPPEVDLLSPLEGAKGASTGALLQWEGTDPEDEPITYDIYLHQTQVFVQGYREEALYMEDYEGDNITLQDLEPGKIYYWTVIPNDGCSDGTCTSGVISFRVNYKPTFKSIKDQKVSAGVEFKYKISATDEDSEDLPNLRYSLVDPPEGMTISEDTGMIRWTPNDDQVILHTITVEVSDGIESTISTFRVEVTEGKSSSSISIFIIILIVVVIVILLALGIFFFIKQKKKMDEEALHKGEEERAALEKEKEEETGPSYEDLYGVPAPEIKEEGMTTSELKDYVHDQIEELEGEE